MGESVTEHVEDIRQIWTPDKEVVEIALALDPQGELASMNADFVHRLIEQKGPQTLLLEAAGNVVYNSGFLRWEIVHFAPTAKLPGHREVSLWIEH